MAVVNVKEFCKRTGFPLATLRSFCREGKLSHWKRGRVYLIDENDALCELERLKETAIYRSHPVNNRMFKKRRETASGSFDYRAKIASLKEQCKTNNLKAK